MIERLYKSKEECCGCSACVNICHKHAICMEQDEKGYLYPKILPNLCVNCGLCETVCPLKKEEPNEPIWNQIAYGVKNHNQDERMRSSSGSVFIEAAKYILNHNGVVYGVELTSDFQVKHGRASNLEEARRFQGSKYVQSEKHEIFQKVQTDLKKGKPVLFTGTPCEVAGLKAFLRREYENLYTLDLICHGVPSVKSLKANIKEKEHKYASKIEEVTFRDKAYGWRNQEIYMKFECGSVYHAPIWEDQFYRLFTNNYILRDSCYACRFSNMERQGDITIGDFWNIKNVDQAFEDKLGVSSLIINSEKGRKLFEIIEDRFEVIECTLSDVTQHNLVEPSLRPERYAEFQKDCAAKGFDYCLKKYGSIKLEEKIRRILSPIKQKLMKLHK